MYTAHDKITDLQMVVDAVEKTMGTTRRDLEGMRRSLLATIEKHSMTARHEDLLNELGDSINNLNEVLSDARNRIQKFEQIYPEYRVDLRGVNEGYVYPHVINQRKRQERSQKQYIEKEEYYKA